MVLRSLFFIGAWLTLAPVSVMAVESFLEQKISPKIAEIVKWAASPVIVEAVLAQNRARPAAYAAITPKAWEALSESDAFVVASTANPAAKFLRTLRRAAVSEIFLNDETGCKVAFLKKTTRWNHQGQPKHDQPMAGKIWHGPVELDQSSGTRQIQVAVPVLSEGKPIGSLVVGLNVFEIADW